MSKTLATSTTVTQRDPKGSHFMLKCGGIYDKAGLSEARAQLLNEHPYFGNELAKLIERCSQLDNRFEFITSFEVEVPVDYVQGTRMSTFGEAHEKGFACYDPNLIDANFAKTAPLIPGQKFLVKVFQIKGKPSSEDCLVQLRRLKARLVGAQGLTVVYEQAREKLPVNRRYLSFDEEKNLPLIDGYHGVPRVNRYSSGVCEFDLRRWGVGWDDYCLLLAFCDLPADEV
jgi:hypothetical protein